MFKISVKNILVSVLSIWTVFSCMISSAQKIGNFELHQIYSTSIDSLRTKIDSLATQFPTSYKFAGQEVNPATHDLILKYKDSANRPLHFTIGIEKVVRDSTAGNQGKEVYYVHEILGKSKDIFGVFKQMKPNANYEDIVSGFGFVTLMPLFGRYTESSITLVPTLMVVDKQDDLWLMSLSIQEFLQHLGEI